MKNSHKIIILKSLFISVVILVGLIITFKKIRAIFPIPMINDDRLVGFSQYFGYPLYFDTLFFFFLVLVPIITFMIFYELNRKK